MTTKVKLVNDTYLEFKKTAGDKLLLVYKSAYPAIFYDRDTGENIKKEGGVELEVEMPLSQLVDLYLKAKTFGENFTPEDTIIVEDSNKRVLFYKVENKPFYLTVKGIDYNIKQAGIMYIDTTNYTWVLFLSYLKTVLQKFPILTFWINKDIKATFNIDERLLTIEDSDVGKVHYIEADEINTMQELLAYYDKENLLYTHSFTPDHNIAVYKDERFMINDKEFDFNTFRKLVYLTQV